MTDDLARRVHSTAAVLEQAARDSGAIVSADKRVSEGVAATLLGVDVKKLRRLRYAGDLPSFQLGVNGGRISYRIAALASFIEGSQDDGRWTSLPATADTSANRVL